MNLIETLDRIGVPLKRASASHYRVDAPLGVGGHGIVSRGTDMRSGTAVVIKRINPSVGNDQRDLLEARLLREAYPGVSDRHIITATDCGRDEHGLYVVFPLAPGKDLMAHTEDGWLPTDNEIKTILTKMAKGLVAIHAAGRQHGDIKPNNTVYDPVSQTVYLIDLGLISDPNANPRLTRPDRPLGTLAFAAPECITSPCQRDPRSDLHAFGCVVYWFYCGESPYEAASEAEAIHRVTQEVPAPLAEINPATPPHMAALTGGLLAKHPDDRWPQTAREVVDVLEGRLKPYPATPPRFDRHAMPRCLACGSPSPDSLRCPVCGRSFHSGLVLRCVFVDGRTRSFRLSLGRYVIGRDQISRSNPCLSRQQAEVEVTESGMWLRNLASANPSVIDNLSAPHDRMAPVHSRLQMANVTADLLSHVL